MEKREIIDEVNKIRKDLICNLMFKEKDLEKLTKQQLTEMLIKWRTFRLVEFCSAKEGEEIANLSCENCKSLLDQAKKENRQILLSISERSKWHIVGVAV